MTHHSRPNRDQDPLLTVRTALIFLFAILTAVGAGVLTCLAGGPPAAAALVAAGALASGVKFFHWLIN